MGSKPITQRAGTRYGSAPANQEVTVDPGGTTPAKFERMSPVKQTTDLPKTDPPKSVEQDVRDESSNDLLLGRASFSFGPDKVSINRKETMRDLTDADVWRLNRNNVQGDYPDFKSYQTAAQTFRDQQGESFTPAQIGTGQFTEILNRKPGDILSSFSYKPQVENIDTEKLRESRQTSRIVKGSGRRATAAGNQVDRLNKRLKRIKDKNPGLSQENLEKLPNYSRIQRKLNNKTKAAEALQNRFNQNVELVKSGVNPYNTRRSEQNKKATGSEPTKEEFESRYSDGGTGFIPSKSFTSGSIKFYNPKLPSSNSTISDFSGSGSYLNRTTSDSSGSGSDILNLHNSAVYGNQGDLFNNPRGPQKRGYKMGGYGTKNK